MFFRIIIEYELLPPVPLTGDGNGEFGLFATRDVDPFDTEMTNCFHFSFDEQSRDYVLDDGQLDTLTPSDSSILDQYNNNLKSASETEVLMRSVRQSEEESDKPKEKDLLKKHSSIGNKCIIFLIGL